MKVSTRVNYWFPVVLWYGFIGFLSSIPANDLSAVPQFILKWIAFPGNPLTQLPLNFYIFLGHRIAHIIEYGMLGCLVLRAYSYEVARVTVLTILFLAIFIFLSGCLDEWHQSFVPGRTPQLIDAIFDTICGALGMLAFKMRLET